MPLILGIELHEDFFVGDERFELVEINLPTRMKVKRVRDGKVFPISDTEAQEIAPEVFLSSGKPLAAKRARCALDAPTEIRIMRGHNYREAHAHG
ncbi:hypothetical protein EVC30_139 [Rhizobium phage RHph_Y1_11]|nr:hypothetical protein EVC30_139 [Rhizobium phage RHph_Y1_11]